MAYASPAFSAPDHLHVQVLVVDRLDIALEWAARDVCSSYWRFYVNSRDGAEVLLADGSPYPLPGRQVHLIPAWVRFSCRNRQRIDHLFVHFDLVGLPGVAARELFPRPLSLPRDALLLSVADDLADGITSRSAAPPMILAQAKALVLLGLARLLRGLPAERGQRLTQLLAGSGRLEPALRRIDEALDRPLANVELAGLCGLGEDGFIRAFRTALGQTPAQYVRERRVAAAARRLVASEEPIADIAAACGFPDRFYFSRVFAAVIGLPPARYRRNGRV